ncbi:MAG TPA: hypothetical protein VJ828_13270, partial [Lacipirellulaceae bacterium]|nr:hypothetical protein [Lacipirellulaceae bacterium]
IGVGTWGNEGPATVRLRTFADANPALGYNVSSITGTYVDVNGTTRTGTWNIESRQQVREKTQLALDRGMPGMFTWTLHYDATNDLGLHRVMHHYMAFQRGVPDLYLDGQVDAADAHKLADEIGTVPGWTGTNTPARFDDFYLSGNWEKGDRDGNGFVNQQDADWLAARFAAMDVALPDRLAYTGTFERFADGRGLSGRWQAVPGGLGQLPETGNFTQHDASFLSFSGNGPGASLHSNSAVTLRNQNAAEAFDSPNMAPRRMRVELVEPIDLAQNEDTYVTFLIRQNTAPLLVAQVASPNRTLALEFLDAAGQNQFQFAFHAQQQQFAIENQADAAGDDVAAGGFAPDTTYLFIGKIAGNGGGASTLQASLFANGSIVGRFIDPGFAWMLTASGGAGFDPTITQLRFTSLFEANYTVSNVWIGGAHDFFAPTPAEIGDFNADGSVDAADYVVWRKNDGSLEGYNAWRTNFGRIAGSSSSHFSAVPEPTAATLSCILLLIMFARRKHAAY